MKVKILHFVLVFLLFIPLGFSLFPNRPYYNSTCEQLCESFGYSYGICRGYSLGSNITRIGGCKDNETSIGQTSDCYTPRGLVGGGKFCCCGGTSRAAVSNISCETDEDCPQPRCVGGKASCVNGVCVLTSFCADPTQSRACEDDSDCVFRNDLCGCYNKDFVPPGNLPDIYCGEILGVDDIPNCRCESGTCVPVLGSHKDTEPVGHIYASKLFENPEEYIDKTITVYGILIYRKDDTVHASGGRYGVVRTGPTQYYIFLVSERDIKGKGAKVYYKGKPLKCDQGLYSVTGVLKKYIKSGARSSYSSYRFYATKYEHIEQLCSSSFHCTDDNPCTKDYCDKEICRHKWRSGCYLPASLKAQTQSTTPSSAQTIGGTTYVRVDPTNMRIAVQTSTSKTLTKKMPGTGDTYSLPDTGTVYLQGKVERRGSSLMMGNVLLYGVSGLEETEYRIKAKVEYFNPTQIGHTSGSSSSGNCWRCTWNCGQPCGTAVHYFSRPQTGQKACAANCAYGAAPVSCSQVSSSYCRRSSPPKQPKPQKRYNVKDYKKGPFDGYFSGCLHHNDFTSYTNEYGKCCEGLVAKEELYSMYTDEIPDFHTCCKPDECSFNLTCVPDGFRIENLLCDKGNWTLKRPAMTQGEYTLNINDECQSGLNMVKEFYSIYVENMTDVYLCCKPGQCAFNLTCVDSGYVVDNFQCYNGEWGTKPLGKGEYTAYEKPRCETGLHTIEEFYSIYVDDVPPIYLCCEPGQCAFNLTCVDDGFSFEGFTCDDEEWKYSEESNAEVGYGQTCETPDDCKNLEMCNYVTEGGKTINICDCFSGYCIPLIDQSSYLEPYNINKILGDNKYQCKDDYDCLGLICFNLDEEARCVHGVCSCANMFDKSRRAVSSSTVTELNNTLNRISDKLKKIRLFSNRVAEYYETKGSEKSEEWMSVIKKIDDILNTVDELKDYLKRKAGKLNSADIDIIKAKIADIRISISMLEMLIS